ncbi:uncharacterized protein LOC100370268 [Saccoglossus kowalevskii]|uniref:Uncharacterized protein LOC100370268 n=1 Tax=Saccoglossus kowalevskii TaxID=10224 RepID=A0ABM0GUX8_SACKO|nr:PREDICTED: uncharacterized protein LOC100370268 [Saccoglossus kowalevskii]
MWRIVHNVQRGFRQFTYNQPLRTTNLSQQNKNQDEDKTSSYHYHNGLVPPDRQVARIHCGVSSDHGGGDGNRQREDWNSFKQRFSWSTCHGSSTVCEAMGWGTAIAVGLHLCRNIGRIDWVTDDDKTRFQRALGRFALAMPRTFKDRLATTRMSVVTEGTKQQDSTEQTPEQLLLEVRSKFESLADESTGTVLNAVGLNYVEKRNFVKAAEEFRQASDMGHGKAMYNLGICYEQGMGVSQSLAKAAEYYKQAADKGHPMALYNLAVFHLMGLAGLKKDTQKAIDLMENAAEQGLLQAQSYLGVYYTEAPHRNLEKAFELFQGAAASEDAESQYYLGICYEQGWGNGKNTAKAADLYAKAAHQGHAGAQYNLAVFYEMGLGGLPIDKSYAKDLYKLASESGSQLAAQGIARIEKDEKIALLESAVNKPLPSQHSVPNFENTKPISKPKSLHASVSSPALTSLAETPNNNKQEILGMRKQSQSVLNLCLPSLFQFEDYPVCEADIKGSQDDMYGISIDFDGNDWLSQFGLGISNTNNNLHTGHFGFSSIIQSGS